MQRFNQVKDDILTEDMRNMIRKNGDDVAYPSFERATFQGLIKRFQRDEDMRNIVITDAEVRKVLTRYLFSIAAQEVRAQ